jgi:hypothetical protein
MKKLLLTLIILILFSAIMNSQVVSRDFGVVSMDEINMQRYDKDPSADAVVLFDLGDTRFIDARDYNYDVQFTRVKRIKIFKQAGVKYAEIEIPFYISEKGDAEVVNIIEAFSYNLENGQVNRSSVDPSTIYTEKINDRWSQKKFVIPNVKPGSVIEYRFVLQSPFHFNLPSWRFQDFIPTMYSRYIARIIPFYSYAFIMQGAKRFDSQSSVNDQEERVWGTLTKEHGNDVGEGVRFHDVVNTFVLKDVPAFKDEAYITSPDDYMIKIDFQESMFTTPQGTKTEIISTWPKLVKELLKNDNFGKYMKAADKPAKKIIETELDLNGKNDADICKTVINYVKTGFKWNEYNSLYTGSLRDFLKQKNGNPAEINLFLTAMLRAAGINASPVIISTRKNGRVNTNYPFLHYFNYVVVLINLGNQQFFADGSDFFTDYNRIPSKCINDKGLLISVSEDKPDEVSWVSLNQNYRSVDNKTVTMEIDPATLKISTRVALQAAENDAAWYKETFRNDTTRIKKHFTDQGLTAVNKVSTLNFERNDLPYTIAVEGEAEAEQLNNSLIISPYLSFYPKENKLKQPVRTFPIDFIYANTESYLCRIAIPQGYKVLTLPETFLNDNDIARIKVNYTVTDNLITVESEYSFKKAVNPATDFSNIKSYFDVIVKKFNEQIILVKK